MLSWFFSVSMRGVLKFISILIKSSVRVAVNVYTEDLTMQTELFDLPLPRTLSEDSTVSKTSFLEKTFITLRLDQAIGLTLILLVIYVLTFSWGVEKGKEGFTRKPGDSYGFC